MKLILWYVCVWFLLVCFLASPFSYWECYDGGLCLCFSSQIRKMDLEARSLQPGVKAMLLAKLREYKSDLNKLKREVKRITSPNTDQAREELLEAGLADSHKVLFSP